MLTVFHAEVALDLNAAAAELPAAEAHGCLCGALSALDGYTFEQWLAEIAPEPAQAQGLGRPDSPLRLVFDTTGQSLRLGSMEFTPLLPDDEAALADRTEALAQWTQGFLYGLATGEIGRNHKLPETVQEILGDFAEIGRATLALSEDPTIVATGDESDEEAYAELYEFVRVGAQLVYDELAPLRHTDL